MSKSQYRTPAPRYDDLPKWFKDIRGNSNFMPAKIKPMSYNYMADIPTYRAQVYAPAAYVPITSPSNPLQSSRLDVGTKFHRPSDDVATEIKKNFTIWQDIKNLGGEVVEHGGNLLGKVGDVFSRLGYAWRNVQLQNAKMNYATPGSAGGTSMTGGEHVSALFDLLTPKGVVQNIAKGQMDDMLYAGWQGLSGKAKTSTTDLVKLANPKWAEDHSTAMAWIGGVGDIVLDPITWVTMGVNPGSVTRAGVAGTKLVTGNKIGAYKTMQDTIFTASGRSASKAALRSDTLGRETNKLLRKARKAEARASKAATGNLKLQAARKGEAYYKARAAEYSAKHSTFIASDLKGMQLAKLAIKQNINPLVALNTASRATTGARQGSAAIRAGTTVKETMDAYHLSMVDAFRSDDNWQVAYEMMKGKDVTYTHGRGSEKPYTVDLKDKDTFDDWMLRVIQEAAPVAKITESGPKAARSRLGRIGITEARAADFINQFGLDHSNLLGDALTGDLKWHYGNQTRYRMDPKLPDEETLAAEMASDARVKLTQEQFDNLTVEELYKVTKSKWDAVPKEQRVGVKNPKRVIIVDEAGNAVEAINLREASAVSKRGARTAGLRAAGGAAAETRTPAQRATDALSGVDDTLAARRAAFVKHFEDITARSPEHASVVSRLINRISDFEDPEDVAKVDAILKDNSLSPIERVRRIIADENIEDETVQELVRAVLGITITDEGKILVRQSKGLSQADALKAVPDVIRAVVGQRWASRVEGGGLPEASGVNMVNGKFVVDKTVKGANVANYRRDVNSEIALSILDGMRAGLDYAVQMDLMRDNPEILFDVLSDPITKYLNDLTASTRTEVMQLMYNATGIRLPDTFVPTKTKIRSLLSGEVKLETAASTAKNPKYLKMERVWRNLALKAQSFITDGSLFGEHSLKPIYLYDDPRQGLDVERMGAAIKSLADMKVDGTLTDAQKLQHNAWVDKVQSLKKYIKDDSTMAANLSVNRYTMLDFLIHGKQIMKSQEISMRTASHGADSIQRVTTGRLSALDSFDFVSDEVKEGLEALDLLRRQANSSTASPRRAAAQKALAEMFIEEGGFGYLDTLKNIDSPNFEPHFNTMGFHARLKEGSFDTTGAGFGPKQAADMMELLWGDATLNHEWHKSLQHAILGEVIVKGMPMNVAAAKLGDRVDLVFQNHERLKKLLHPVVNRPEGPMPRGRAQTRNIAKEFEQSASGRNQMVAEANAPTNTIAADAEIPLRKGTAHDGTWETLEDSVQARKDLKEKGITVPGTKPGEKIGKLIRISDDLEDGVVYPVKLGDGTFEVRYVGKPTAASPTGVVRVSKSKTPYKAEDAKQAFKDLTTPEGGGAVKREPYSKAAPVSYPEGNVLASTTGKKPKGQSSKSILSIAEEEPVALGVSKDTAMADTADALQNARLAGDEGALAKLRQGPDTPVEAEGSVFDEAVNINEQELKYTDEERDIVNKYIAENYEDVPPQAISKELHSFNTALTIDLMDAQLKMADHLKELNLTNKANVRFMGVPFMPVGNPINSNHALAGVTTYAQARSGAFRFWNKIQGGVDTRINPNTGKLTNRAKFTRQSQLLDGGINQILTSTVNAVSVDRKLLVERVNSIGRRLIGKDFEFVNPTLGSMKNTQKWKRANELFFDTSGTKLKAWTSEFDNVDGVNPLSEIDADLSNAASSVFDGLIDPKHGVIARDEFFSALESMNHYLGDEKYKFTPAQMNELKNYSLMLANLDERIVPFTREWFIAISDKDFVMGSRYHKTKLPDINLTNVHMAVSNAALRVREGRALYEGAWDEFAAQYSASVVKFRNEQAVPNMMGANGEPLRGRLIALDDITKGPWGIDRKYIPKRFLSEKGSDAPRYYVDEQLLKELEVAFKYMDERHELNNIIDTQFMNKILGQFKASVTIYKIPTYPIRNTIADVFMSAMDGLTNPRYYRDGARISQNMNKYSKKMDTGQVNFDGLIDKNYLNRELARNVNDPEFKPVDPAVGAPRTTLHLKTQTGQDVKLTDQQIYDIFQELGLGQNRVSSEFAESLPESRRGAMRGVGQLPDGARFINDFREDWMRLSHFLYALEREAPLGGDIMDIARRAGDRVIKHHFDYDDVSLWERKILGQAIPFYKWVRNVIPYTIASVVARPYALKIEHELTKAVGASVDDDKDDTRTDFVVPQWIEEDNPVSIGSYADPNGNRFMQWMSLNLPLSETLSGTFAPTLNPWIDPSTGDIKLRAQRSAEGVIRLPFSMLNPLIGGFTEAATGQSVFAESTRASDGGWVGTLTDIIPGVAAGRAATKGFGNALKPKNEGENNPAAWLKALGIATVKNNSEASQIGEMKRLQDMNRGQRDKLEGEIRTKLLKKYPQLTPDQTDMIIEEYRAQLRSANSG